MAKEAARQTYNEAEKAEVYLQYGNFSMGFGGEKDKNVHVIGRAFATIGLALKLYSINIPSVLVLL